MDKHDIANLKRCFRCGLPTTSLKDWLEEHGQERLQIATYGVSTFNRLGHYLPRDVLLELLVGISGIDPFLIRDLHDAPEPERWQRLLEKLGREEQNHVLRTLSRLVGWERAGAKIRVSLPGEFRGLMHLKLYLGKNAALVGSANFTLHAVEGIDQHELLLELRDPTLTQLRNWWETVWATAWSITVPSEKRQPVKLADINDESSNQEKEKNMIRGAQILLGHWLGEWGAWALNGNGVVAYPHQLQAVEWIRPDRRAYLLGDQGPRVKNYLVLCFP